MESTKKDNIPDTNNNTGKERVWPTESLICASLVPLGFFRVCSLIFPDVLHENRAKAL